ncbi:potassium-transporting ATPase subunit KdpC [Methylomonas sp. AM2-LC]|uniref:potassium-transporting ATPase subunit KdpC n=1 Tax=Methylomonas sp. AM2-LC TaxID=3153301 RepID=UPI003265B8C9
MINYFRPAVVLLLLFTLLTGAIYPVLVTGLAQLLFPAQANGSLLKDKQGQLIGSELIGQAVFDPKYFWGRPSATAPYANNGAASSGSNLGPTNPALIEAVAARVQALKEVDPDNHFPVPVDLVTSSASGLDPHISLASAHYQVKRIAKLRKINADQLQDLVNANSEDRQWWVFGEPRVNVLKLNLALDQMAR